MNMFCEITAQVMSEHELYRGQQGSGQRGVSRDRGRLNMAHAKQSRPDSGFGFQIKVVKKNQVVIRRWEAGRKNMGESDGRVYRRVIQW